MGCFCTEAFCNSVTLIGAMRGGAQGGCQLWAATLQLRCPENRARAQWISPDIAGMSIACSFLILFRNEYLNTYLKQNEIEILNFLEPRRWHHVGVGFDSGSLKMKHCGKTCASKETAAPAAESSKGGSWLCNKQPTRTAQ